MPRRGDTGQVYRSRVRIPIIAVTMALMAAVTGCGALGGDSGNSSTSGSAGASGPVEKPKIKVGLLPVVDVAPLYQAIDKGYFKQQGLEVEPITVSSGPKAVEGMIGGDLDIAFTSYPGAFVAQAKGAAKLKIVADAYAARPGHLVLVALKDSKLQRPEDAGGKKIAVTSKGSISDLGAMSVLETKGVKVEQIDFRQMSFPEMGPAMQRGDIDGAVVAEPWVTRTEKEFGALQLMDVSSGPTQDISMTGWAAMEKLTTENPNTFAAFQRGLAKGVDDVKKDRGTLDQILVKNIKIDQATAQLVHIADYPVSLDAVRLQRVADLMKKFNVITSDLKVQPMLLASPVAK
ncbi:NitT/TauT family transport system substrate-binding protein [Kibdelosporangium banguiense]|uniref:NitT/TauT family transport system substrate-binding protein n=1 Tax=Kibdelosporangium banguiense TaxID=1365924 RepID=A0ABS4T9W9_9PSEU|nr:ABC transporter substrate-binding protein [Kibdelosporangium banguiense]MBP2321222.1 NitT/TauT family transport system substrate-binding protein [Kibdelosporangium banguiense]